MEIVENLVRLVRKGGMLQLIEREQERVTSQHRHGCTFV